MEKQAAGSRPRFYTEEYKRQVVDLLASTGRTATSVAAEVGVHHTLLSRWTRQYGRAEGSTFADRGYDAEGNRALCRSFGAEPGIHERRQPSGSGLGRQRWPVERSNAWLLENKRLALRHGRLGFIVQALLQTACMLLAAGKLGRNSENHLLGRVCKRRTFQVRDRILVR